MGSNFLFFIFYFLGGGGSVAKNSQNLAQSIKRLAWNLSLEPILTNFILIWISWVILFPKPLFKIWKKKGTDVSLICFSVHANNYLPCIIWNVSVTDELCSEWCCIMFRSWESSAIELIMTHSKCDLKTREISPEWSSCKNAVFVPFSFMLI